MKFIIISNRLPLKIVRENNGYQVISSPGGLTTGLDSLDIKAEKYWIGWPGLYLDEGNQKDAIDKLLIEQKYHPVYLTPDLTENFYEGYCNSILWPLCHYFPTYIQYENRYWEAYKKVNRIFCEEALKVIEPGDIVWIQDYQLMLLPQMIREEAPDTAIGYFHHIPFPSYELFRSLPERAELLNGLLGSDLVAFHTHGYMRHFISAVYRVLKLDCQLDEIHLGGRSVNVDAFPMGINYEMYNNALLDVSIKRKAKELKRNLGDGKLILSVDRLDYSKGISIRLKSFADFLDNNPHYRKKVSLVMIVAPSRDTVERYASLKDLIDKMVGNINGKHSTVDWTPVHYFYRTFDFKELTALYHISDIAMITPLRDGMNLVAKEYIATKRKQPGVLILSEMAGASIELSEAIIVNPTNTKEIEDAILKALEMPKEEQIANLKIMKETISVQTVAQWAKDFTKELQDIRESNKSLRTKIVEEENFKTIKRKYDRSHRRLIIMDYDGTLAPFHNNPLKAYPSLTLLDLLSRLSEDRRNKIVISSGRDRHTLDAWFGHLPIGLTAEHGAFYKEDGVWHKKTKKIKWDKEIIDILDNTVRRTPRSKVEIKDTSIVWHYRNVDSWLADLRVPQLIDSLINPCSRLDVQIMRGNKIIEVKHKNLNKGSEAARLAGKDHYDFIMAMGDDTTDEDMFLALPNDVVSIKVGKNSSIARYNIPAQPQTLTFLDMLMK